MASFVEDVCSSFNYKKIEKQNITLMNGSIMSKYHSILITELSSVGRAVGCNGYLT